MPLDPQLQTLIEQMQATNQPSLSDLEVTEARALVEQMATLVSDRKEVAEVKDLVIPGPAV